MIVNKIPTMVVYKYELVPPEGPSGTLAEIELPKGATILRIAPQGGQFFLWALICKDVQETVKRKWLVVGTGHEFSAKAFADIALIAARDGRSVPFEYQETALALNDALVFHFWLSHPVP